MQAAKAGRLKTNAMTTRAADYRLIVVGDSVGAEESIEDCPGRRTAPSVCSHRWAHLGAHLASARAVEEYNERQWRARLTLGERQRLRAEAEVRLWAAVGVGWEAAQVWWRTYTVEEALPYLAANWEPREAEEWEMLTLEAQIREGVPTDPGWLEAGLPFKVAVLAFEAGISPAEAAAAESLDLEALQALVALRRESPGPSRRPHS
jgi:hypothetical protein